MTDHQVQQQKVINKIEEQVNTNSLKFSTVPPVEDYDNDPRICLTSVHLPHESLKLKVYQLLIEPLKDSEPDFYYYTPDSLHMTIKNIRTINNPPRFTEEDIEKAKKIFSEIISQHQRFNVYFYKLLLFPNNIALVGTTDPELDSIVCELDDALNKKKIPDDKVYANSQYFFCNMTLARFNKPPSREFKQKVLELSNSIRYEPYAIDSVTLLKSNAVLKNRQIIGTWNLKK